MPKKKKTDKEFEKIVDFIFEAGTARNLIRSHNQVLRQVNDSISSHSFRTAIIGLILADLEKADSAKIVKMCLLHDLAEVRTGDSNFINKFYRIEKEHEAVKDQWSDLPGGEEAIKILSEYNARKTKEAIVAKDADSLDQIFLQKEYLSEKPADFKRWHEHIACRIKTSSARKIAGLVFRTNPLKWVYNIDEAEKKGEKHQC
ncbi:MAG: HD domain-containing protein [Candidatus Nealsonbacteria bacterium]|nr:HD domain-containing protein [Candidatus Nealsonbacteria bacterium]